MRCPPVALLSLVALAACSLAACSKAPPEPDATPASSTAPAPAVAPLVWDPPTAWTRVPTPPSGAKKAAYRIAKVADDKEEAEVEVLFYGTGAKGDVPANFKAWLGQFDGDANAAAKRDKLESRGLEIETIEHVGTYKISLGPPPRGRKKPPVQMVKNGFRLLGAAVKTKDRGNWFFKLAGPSDTVEAARSAFRAMLESAR